MNNCREWWEKARKSTGVLTKPIQKRLLEQKVKELTKNQKELQAFLVQYKVNNLAELVEKLNQGQQEQKITELENKLADNQAELKKVSREKESLLAIKEELEVKIKETNTQLDNLLFSIDRGIINQNWKKEITTSLNLIKDAINQDK